MSQNARFNGVPRRIQNTSPPERGYWGQGLKEGPVRLRDRSIIVRRRVNTCLLPAAIERLGPAQVQ
jgi:hypothetical protein